MKDGSLDRVSCFSPPTKKQDENFISPWVKPLSLMSSAGAPTLRVHDGMRWEQKLAV